MLSCFLQEPGLTSCCASGSGEGSPEWTEEQGAVLASCRLAVNLILNNPGMSRALKRELPWGARDAGRSDGGDSRHDLSGVGIPREIPEFNRCSGRVRSTSSAEETAYAKAGKNEDT